MTESMDKVKCNWRDCLSGMGLAGQDGEHCAMELHGATPREEKCKCFMNEEEYHEEHVGS